MLDLGETGRRVDRVTVAVAGVGHRAPNNVMMDTGTWFPTRYHPACLVAQTSRCWAVSGPPDRFYSPEGFLPVTPR
ncbi:MAG: Uncharacterised protein [Cellulomonadaceae bacterium TMED98]|nr:MAG: Uncharacterised protein [Cellulomonadaceae bacterium TMED98]